MGNRAKSKLILIKDIALMLISVLAIVMGATWGVRETWSNNYRLADVEIYNNAMQVNGENGTKNDIAENVTMRYIELSEDFRRASIYMSLATGHQILAIVMFSVAFLFAVGDAENKTARARAALSLIFLLVGFFFVVSSGVAVSYKYSDNDNGYLKLGSLPYYEKFSWCFADLFPSPLLPVPPLIAPSDLERSQWAQNAIDSNPTLKQHLDNLSSHKDIVRLKELAGVSQSSCTCEPVWIGIAAVAIIVLLALVITRVPRLLRTERRDEG
jgi:hypothetical protein